MNWHNRAPPTVTSNSRMNSPNTITLMRQFSTLTKEELDEQIRQLEARISELDQPRQLTIEEQLDEAISIREKQYIRDVKLEYIAKVTGLSNELKKRIAFTTVCKKYYSQQFVLDMLSCFNECHTKSNWRKIHRLIYKAKINNPNNTPPVSFLASFYKRYVLGYSSYDVSMTRQKMLDEYSDFISDFQSTKIFCI